jgi:hypothetical protein
LGTDFLGGLRNPIFLKNRISFSQRISWARISWTPWARFEKSDFSQKSDFLGTDFLGGLRNPIFLKNRISWARISWAPWVQFEKSDFSQKSDFLGTFGNFES